MAINLTILDNFDPETMAMLQAFYSRNHMPIQQRLAELGEDQASIKESLKKWLVGYGHKSIGQCAATTIFLEGVSLLAAKVYQDTPLYNGQETSTRYIDFSNQPIHDPLNDTTGIQQKWLNFYTEHQQAVILHIAKNHNLNLDDEVEYKTARAGAFDILRAFLPAGCATQLSWFTTFTHAADRVVQLCYHPLHEVRVASRGIAEYLQGQYPYAFADLNAQIEKFAEYYSANSLELNYLVASDKEFDTWPEFEVTQTFKNQVRTSKGLSRVLGTPVPKHLQYNGRFQFKYLLDFGSFRDIQRHRPCVQMLPVLTTRYGFEQWYIDALPFAIQEKAKVLIYNQVLALTKLGKTCSETDLQYYIPLGFKVPGLLDCDYPQLVYISEMRSNQTVHPTLRTLSRKMLKVAKDCYLVNMFGDDSETAITTKRGKQDIVKR